MKISLKVLPLFVLTLCLAQGSSQGVAQEKALQKKSLLNKQKAALSHYQKIYRQTSNSKREDCALGHCNLFSDDNANLEQERQEGEEEEFNDRDDSNYNQSFDNCPECYFYVDQNLDDHLSPLQQKTRQTNNWPGKREDSFYESLTE